MDSIQSSNKTGNIWEVMSWLHGELIPVAAFSQAKYAEKLAIYLKPTNDPLDPDPNWDDDNIDEEEIVLDPFFKLVDSTDLKLDQYLPELKAGQMPFDITIKKNGDVFRAKRAKTLFETAITPYYGVERTDNGFVQIKSTAVYSIFWAVSRSAAIELAMQFIDKLNSEGALEIPDDN